jgi:hypothetical protein
MGRSPQPHCVEEFPHDEKSKGINPLPLGRGEMSIEKAKYKSNQKG